MRQIPTVLCPGYLKVRSATHARMLREFSLSCFHSYIRSEREGKKEKIKRVIILCLCHSEVR